MLPSFNGHFVAIYPAIPTGPTWCQTTGRVILFKLVPTIPYKSHRNFDTLFCNTWLFHQIVAIHKLMTLDSWLTLQDLQYDIYCQDFVTMKNIVIWGETGLVDTHFEALLDAGSGAESRIESISKLISDNRSRIWH